MSSVENEFPSYDELLERAYKLLPKRRPKSTGERFTLPRFEVTVTGKRVYITNFKEVAEMLNRDPHTLLRFLLKEIALPGTYEENTAVIQGEVSPQLLNKLLERFFNDYVKCPICGSPDTLLIKEKKIMQIKCMACGAVSPVKPF
ncbi:MAG: translation initiation factor IF-2 subunit beta [Infirmifilum sp.]